MREGEQERRDHDNKNHGSTTNTIVLGHIHGGNTSHILDRVLRHYLNIMVHECCNKKYCGSYYWDVVCFSLGLS